MAENHNFKPFYKLRTEARKVLVASLLAMAVSCLVAVGLYLAGFRELALGVCLATACLMCSALWLVSFRKKLLHLTLHPHTQIVNLQPGNVRQVGFDCCSDIAVIDRKSNIEVKMTDIIRISEAYKAEDAEDWERLKQGRPIA